MTQEELTKENFKEKIGQADKSVFVDFWAPWCGPCQKMNPIIEELEQEYIGEVEFVKLNIEENERLASSLDVLKIPTFVLYQDGEEVDKRVGVAKKEDLKGMIDKNIA